MSHRKLLAGVAVVAALGAGATAGVLLGVPGLSSAQTPTPGPHPRAPFAGFGLRGGGASLAVAAKDLGMTPAALKTALQGGQSIAALATAKSVDPQKIINDLVADATTRIDTAVSSGKITAAQAATIKAGLTTGITAFVNGTRPPLPPGVTGTAIPKLGPKLGPKVGPGLGLKLAAAPSLAVAAKDLGMTPADLKTALKGGQSIAALATSRKVDPQKIINDLVADETTRIDTAVSSGKITAAQAATIKAGLTTGITAFVNGTGGPLGHVFRAPFPRPFGGAGGGPFGGPGGGKVPTSTATPGTI